MLTYKRYQAYLLESLKDPAEAAAYLEAVLEDGDLDEILLALRNVAEARNSKLNSANQTDTNADWESCYQLLAQGELPELPVISRLLGGLGLRLSVTVKEEQAA